MGGELGLPFRSNTSIRGRDGVQKGASVIHSCYDELTPLLRPRQGAAEAGAIRGQVLPDIVLVGSGQDVALVMKTKEILLQWSKSFNDKVLTSLDGFPRSQMISPALLKVRIVSMPCWELFDEQDQEYQDSVLLSNHREVFRVFVEKAATRNTGHDKYAHVSVLMP